MSSLQTVGYVRQLAATNSRTDKEQILLNAWMAGERDLFRAFQLAYDELKPSRMKSKVAEVVQPDEKEANHLTWADFEKLYNDLFKRVVTGNDARDAVHAAAQKANGVIWNEFYRRVLLKDMRCGTTDSTVNKVLKKLMKSDATAEQFIVPVFACALAKDGAEGSDNADKVKGKKGLDVKLDGVRLLTVVDKEAKTVTQYTRDGLENTNFPHIRAAFEVLLQDDTILPASAVFDGEITAASFQTLMTQVNRRHKGDTSTAKLAVFDIIPLKDFKAGYCATSQKDRHTALTGVIGMMLHLSGEVYAIPKLWVDLDTVEGQKAFNEFNQEAITAGYEGIMVKDPDAPYECRRTSAWLKIKPFIELSMEVIGFEEGEKGKANEGSLGALIVRCVEDGKIITSNCGSGFGKDTVERSEIWNNQKKYLGYIAEVRADCLTQEKSKLGTNEYSLRFPRFKFWRGNKKGQKI